MHVIAFSEQFILMTTLYNETQFSRKEEFKKCFLLNIANPFIKKIVVFFENPHESEFFQELEQVTNNIKVEYVEISERPSFSFFFDYANQHFANKNIIVCNADIFFDHTLKLIQPDYLEKTLISLTRYEKKEDSYELFITGFKIGQRHYLCSYDSWIFHTPMPQVDCYNFKIGTWSCEKFLYNAWKAGLKLKNPCLTLKSYHVHDSQVRNYKQEDIYKTFPVVYLKETSLDERSDVVFNLF